MSKQYELERLYTIFPWIEDPESPQGYERYQRVLRDMEKLITHSWIQNILKTRRLVKIIDICSGTGFAGTALSKILRDKGFEIKLTLVDLRFKALEKAKKFGTGFAGTALSKILRDKGFEIKLTLVDLRFKALEKAKKFVIKELRVEPDIIIADVTEKLDIPEKYDVALMWGLTTPHFNPWMWIRVLANISRIISDNGVFIYDEVDRIQSIFFGRGYREVLPELIEENRIVLSIHANRDSKRGDIEKLVVDLATGERVKMHIYFWDLASSAAFTWIFFEDVDFVPAESQFKGFIIAYKPRRTITLEDILVNTPTMISH